MKQQWTLALLLLVSTHLKGIDSTHPLEKRALQPSRELSRNEKWKKFFIDKKFEDSTMKTSLIDLVADLSQRYLRKCTPLITYDVANENVEHPFVNDLLRKFGQPHIHGDVQGKNSSMFAYNKTCKVYILFIEDVMDSYKILGAQDKNKVIIVTKSSQWRVHEYLASRSSQKIVNLLVISKSEMVVRVGEQTPYVLYTHKLYIDAIASSRHTVLTSWRNGRYTRPDLNLFPKKMAEGFAGHRFIISLAHFPPFVIKRGIDSNENIIWDGLEVKIVKLLARTYNFTVDFVEAPEMDDLGSEDAVIKSISEGRGNLGLSGIFISNEITEKVDISNMFYQDCAAFMTLTSTALPRYRAIMGPFHWTVWLSVTFIYLFAIFPLTFSYKHTLKPLLRNPQEMENMFWYVFGTFTNAFTFSEGDSWTNSDKMATRVFIGFYWIFTIIISACYTGSIIAFVTLPVYPETIDKVSQLQRGRYQIGMLDKSGWVDRFANSSEPMVEKLMSKVDLVQTVEEGIKNTTEAFFWPYAFLGSRANLDYIIRTQFVSAKKRAALHISNECLVTYGTAITYPKNSEYVTVLNAGLDRVVQGGFVNKIESDVEWLMMRSSSGKLLEANKGKTNPLIVEDRALTLEDTQGMFLLLGIGFVLAGTCLFFEIFGGCFDVCKRNERSRRRSSIPSNPRSCTCLTPEPRVDSTRIVSTLNFYTVDMSKKIYDRSLGNGQSAESTDLSEATPRSEEVDDDLKDDLSKIDEKIDRLFDFEEYFGERNTNELNFEERYLE
ncbi:ionotropic receptor 21a [Coccinella septempunctata]|uniref:ionotropic receptor 21a n=1 Tax=Coccinella septempunctata TaxID=41139 RepID=UPI001D089049|nr:ionotropic receptor 21a [Coccinella septempunctata]